MKGMVPCWVKMITAQKVADYTASRTTGGPQIPLKDQRSNEQEAAVEESAMRTISHAEHGTENLSDHLAVQTTSSLFDILSCL